MDYNRGKCKVEGEGGKLRGSMNFFYIDNDHDYKNNKKACVCVCVWKLENRIIF